MLHANNRRLSGGLRHSAVETQNAQHGHHHARRAGNAADKRRAVHKPAEQGKRLPLHLGQTAYIIDPGLGRWQQGQDERQQGQHGAKANKHADGTQDRRIPHGGAGQQGERDEGNAPCDQGRSAQAYAKLHDAPRALVRALAPGHTARVEGKTHTTTQDCNSKGTIEDGPGKGHETVAKQGHAAADPHDRHQRHHKGCDGCRHGPGDVPKACNHHRQQQQQPGPAALKGGVKAAETQGNAGHGHLEMHA